MTERFSLTHPPYDKESIERKILSIINRTSDDDRSIWSEIDRLMIRAYQTAGFNWFVASGFWRFQVTLLRYYAGRELGLRQIEQKLRLDFLRNGWMGRQRRQKAVISARKRALASFDKIEGYIKGSTVLDLGSGNGMLAETIRAKTSKKVIPMDVVDYSTVEHDTIIYNQGDPVPLDDNAVDTTILYLVLHHSQDPLHLLNEAKRVTKHRVIIMEGYADNPKSFHTNCFLDWFLNRVSVGEDINLPFNFLTIETWRKIFNDTAMTLREMKILGIDEPLAPEYHVLFILDV